MGGETGSRGAPHRLMTVVNCRTRPASSESSGVHYGRRIPRRLHLRSVLLAAVTAVAGLALSSASAAGADPNQPGPPAPAPPPLAVPQPDNLPRAVSIGGAQAKTNVPQGMGPGTGRPLAEARQRGVVAVPPIATDGVHAATAWPGKQVVIHLPNERALTAANWGEGGAASYGSGPVDYVVIPDAGGGADIRMIRKTFISPSDFTVGIRYPEGTHLRQAAQAVVVETDAAPGHSAAIIGALSIPDAKDGAGNPIPVTPSVGGSYLYQQSDVNLNVGDIGLLNFPVTITVAYRPSTSVPAVAQGDPAPKAPAGSAAGRCVSGPPEKSSLGWGVGWKSPKLVSTWPMVRRYRKRSVALWVRLPARGPGPRAVPSSGPRSDHSSPAPAP
ncbi:Uncharacterised protein [Mycobacteroides abscessus subsp. bolletii]|nr:Uncharacterised protein [Mycobacteroides abscessus subsp. bolletii]SKP87167.1 Uncharacterised protein [Mycobacteroides abscessus subsp. bolletii]SKQ38285.1 Uncharacterised protein [Mycobacteroides abscessus subsp. bolletii]SKQ53327.1 Uncharacterised protein [Mycobacteroides abscessus subsp. bolletii]